MYVHCMTILQNISLNSLNFRLWNVKFPRWTVYTSNISFQYSLCFFLMKQGDITRRYTTLEFLDYSVFLFLLSLSLLCLQLRFYVHHIDPCCFVRSGHIVVSLNNTFKSYTEYWISNTEDNSGYVNNSDMEILFKSLFQLNPIVSNDIDWTLSIRSDPLHLFYMHRRSLNMQANRWQTLIFY